MIAFDIINDWLGYIVSIFFFFYLLIIRKKHSILFEKTLVASFYYKHGMSEEAAYKKVGLTTKERNRPWWRAW